MDIEIHPVSTSSSTYADLGVHCPHLCDKDIFLMIRYVYLGRRGSTFHFCFIKNLRTSNQSNI